MDQQETRRGERRSKGGNAATTERRTSLSIWNPASAILDRYTASSHVHLDATSAICAYLGEVTVYGQRRRSATNGSFCVQYKHDWTAWRTAE